MTTSAPDVVHRYFELDAERDIDGIVALFTNDATVVDEGETHLGAAAIRAWRTGPASTYDYRTTVIKTERTGDNQYRVTARLDGNFPGGTVELRHDFTVTGDRVVYLHIAP